MHCFKRREQFLKTGLQISYLFYGAGLQWVSCASEKRINKPLAQKTMRKSKDKICLLTWKVWCFGFFPLVPSDKLIKKQKQWNCLRTGVGFFLIHQLWYRSFITRCVVCNVFFKVLNKREQLRYSNSSQERRPCCAFRTKSTFGYRESVLLGNHSIALKILYHEMQ